MFFQKFTPLVGRLVSLR